MDLWSWKDDYTQPMQKVRAVEDRSRSYRATVDPETKDFIHLADPDMRDLVLNDSGSFALGADDRAYRKVQEYDERLEHTPIWLTPWRVRASWLSRSIPTCGIVPGGQHALFFDGKDWILITARWEHAKSDEGSRYLVWARGARHLRASAL